MKSFAILKNKEDMLFNKIYIFENMEVWFELIGLNYDSLKVIQPTEDNKYSIEEACNMVGDCYEEKIKKLKQQFKPLKYEYYKEQRDAEILHQIEKTARNMVVDYENGYTDECINRLKAICSLKNKMYSEKSTEIIEARKFNNFIKYKIKELEEKRDKHINYLLHTIGRENENL